jgi:putative transposase
MRQIVAELGIHRIVFTKAYRPMGHGKIEAFNRFATNAFIAEVKASRIKTLDELNEAFVAWADLEYNQRPHTETGAKPIDRWRTLSSPSWADEEKLRVAFLWKENRKPDKTGVFSLFGTEYQVGPALAKQVVEVRFDPERMEELEIWHGGAFVERVKPFTVQGHRRPRAEGGGGAAAQEEPVADYLDHLVKRRRKTLAEPPPPPDLRAAADDAVIALFADRLDPAVRDDGAVRAFLDRHGPFDIDDVRRVLDRLAGQGADLHPSVYLEAVRRELRGER